MFNNATILITGGTGSFGQKLIETLLKDYTPRKIVVFSRDEYKQYEMQKRFNQPCMRYFLGDVRDRQRLETAFSGIDYVVHAAALKQVPAIEYNPDEAIKTNINGAQNVVAAALANNVKKVIALSTDKAAEPVNLYGATKLASDKLFVAGNNIRGSKATTFSVVRYGNVFESRGSVVPFFLELLTQGSKTLPITDPEMTRFSISLKEGVNFTIKAFERMKGGEIFIPKIPSYRITDVANAVAPHLAHEIIGIRPGEKLHEVMCPRELSYVTFEFHDHFVISPSFKINKIYDYSANELGEKGTLVTRDFEYTSRNNTHFLTVEDLKSMINKAA